MGNEILMSVIEKYKAGTVTKFFVEQFIKQYKAALSKGKDDNEVFSLPDYEEVLADHKRLVREVDVILNGENAAKQASLCDIVAQLAKQKKEEVSWYEAWSNWKQDLKSGLSYTDFLAANYNLTLKEKTTT